MCNEFDASRLVRRRGGNADRRSCVRTAGRPLRDDDSEARTLRNQLHVAFLVAGRNFDTVPESASDVAFYATIPSYQAVIAREGVDGVAALAAVGTAEAVSRMLQTHLDAGATDVVPTVLRNNPVERQELWQVAAGL